MSLLCPVRKLQMVKTIYSLQSAVCGLRYAVCKCHTPLLSRLIYIKKLDSVLNVRKKSFVSLKAPSDITSPIFN